MSLDELSGRNLRLARTWDDLFDPNPTFATQRKAAPKSPTLHRQRPALPLSRPLTADSPSMGGTQSGGKSKTKKKKKASPETMSRLAQPKQLMSPVMSPVSSPGRLRPVYTGPPGPGTYAHDRSVGELLSTSKSARQSSFAGSMSRQDRSMTGPFGPAFKSGALPGPTSYNNAKPPSTPTSGSVAKSVIPRSSREVAVYLTDPEIGAAPRGDLSPGPGAYTRDLVPSSPETLKYPESNSRSPARAAFGKARDRDLLGPFGETELKRAGKDNPGPGDYPISSGLLVPVKSINRGDALAAPAVTIGRPSSPKAAMGGTAPRSDPKSRKHLFDVNWVPVQHFNSEPKTGPGCYEGAVAESSMGGQPLSHKRSATVNKIPVEDRDRRYEYLQPGFKKITPKLKTPGPGAYKSSKIDASTMSSSTGMKLGPTFGASGRSPVHRVLS